MRKEKYRRVTEALLEYGQKYNRSLPWRKTRDPWKILVSEYMLQQTQVERVIPKYHEFLKKFPSPHALSKAPLRDLLTLWGGLGYNRRAKHLHLTAGHITDRHKGKVPNTVIDLEKLPGIGPYTSRAILAFAFNQNGTLFDTNIKRIVCRIFFGGEYARKIPDDNTLHSVLSHIFPKGRSREWHNTLMDFGSTVCVSKNPKCDTCPLARSCNAYRMMKKSNSPQVRFFPKQSVFRGSFREVRGNVLRLLREVKQNRLSLNVIYRMCGDRAKDAVTALSKDGLVNIKGRIISLP